MALTSVSHRFNSQPPEGGWCDNDYGRQPSDCFNSQPPEGGWHNLLGAGSAVQMFQLAAARRRLDAINDEFSGLYLVSTRSRPKAAGHKQRMIELRHRVSTRSRPKAAGQTSRPLPVMMECFNSQPPEGGWTAARKEQKKQTVSTRSRPKAAG